MILRTLLASALLIGAAGFAAAQDPVQVDPNVKVEFENDAVRVIRMTFPAGYTTPTHTHDLPGVQVVLIGGRARAEDGTVTEQKAKAATYGEGNRTPHRTEFMTKVETVRIELKNTGTTPVAIPATDAVAVDPAHHKVEFENDQVRVVRMTYPVGYKNPPHTHLRGVTVMLSSATVHTWSNEGEESDTTTEAGSASWGEASAGPHSNEVRGTSPLELVRVELKKR